MHYEIDKADEELVLEESKEGAASTRQQMTKVTEDEQIAGQPLPARPFKKPINVPPLALSEMKRNQEGQQQQQVSTTPFGQ